MVLVYKDPLFLCRLVKVEEVPDPVEGVRACGQRLLPRRQGHVALGVHERELVGLEVILINQD